MLQDQLFFERMEDALGAVIDRCGGRKKFAGEMFPDKALRDAHNLLDAMLNPDRREKFSPSQIMYVARRGQQLGCHAVVQYIAREAGYREPVPIDPDSVEAALQQKFIDAVGTLESIQKQIVRAQQLRKVG